MTRLEKLESDVAALPPADLARFRDWFDSFAADRWDEAIETDMRSGKLDAQADTALADFRANRTRAL